MATVSGGIKYVGGGVLSGTTASYGSFTVPAGQYAILGAYWNDYAGTYGNSTWININTTGFGGAINVTYYGASANYVVNNQGSFNGLYIPSGCTINIGSNSTYAAHVTYTLFSNS